MSEAARERGGAIYRDFDRFIEGTALAIAQTK